MTTRNEVFEAIDDQGPGYLAATDSAEYVTQVVEHVAQVFQITPSEAREHVNAWIAESVADSKSQGFE